MEGMDVDEDDTEEKTHPEDLAPIDAYNRALVVLGVELDDLSRALTNGDDELFDIAAGDAVGTWLAAHAAYRRLIHVFDDAPALRDASRRGLSERYDALLALFDAARDTFGDPRLHESLQGLRKSLEAARP
jgi:myo-inositol catabolism protein IolC